MTIYALSSGPGISGIAVIRVSGSKTKDILSLITNGKLPKARVATLKKIINPNTGELIDEGIRILLSRPELDSAVTVSRYNMWSPLRARKIDDAGLLQPFVPFETFGDPATLNCDRDSQGDVYFADMGTSIVRPHCIENIETGLLPQKWMGNNIYPLIQTGGLDIDYEWQLPAAEHWLRTNGHTEAFKTTG